MNEIFDISKEDLEKSKKIYNGKVIKCLVAPHHTAYAVHCDLALEGNVLHFPESVLSHREVKYYIEAVVSGLFFNYDEIIIVTKSVDIIRDMVASNVRILTSDNEIIKSPIETFMGNIAEISSEILDIEDVPHFGDRYVMELIEEINSYDGKEIPNDVKVDFKSRIEIIGDTFLKCALEEHIK